MLLKLHVVTKARPEKRTYQKVSALILFFFLIILYLILFLIMVFGFFRVGFLALKGELRMYRNRRTMHSISVSHRDKGHGMQAWKFWRGGDGLGGGGGGGGGESRWLSFMSCKLVSKSFLTYSENLLH